MDPDEPDYAAAARLGEEAVPHLERLVRGDDAMLASKATYAASLIEGGADTVETAADSEDPVVRVAAAAAGTESPARAVPRSAPTALPTTRTLASERWREPRRASCLLVDRAAFDRSRSAPQWPTRSKTRPSGQRMKRTGVAHSAGYSRRERLPGDGGGTVDRPARGDRAVKKALDERAGGALGERELHGDNRGAALLDEVVAPSR